MSIMQIKEELLKRGIYQNTILIDGEPATIAYQKFNQPFIIFDFQWHVFFCFSNVSHTVTQTTVQNFYNQTYKYASKNYRGRRLGDNSGMIVVSVLTGNQIDETAIRFCTRFRSTRFAVREIPITFNTDTGEYHAPKFAGIWGFAFFRFYRKMVKETIAILDHSNAVIL